MLINDKNYSKKVISNNFYENVFTLTIMYVIMFPTMEI